MKGSNLLAAAFLSLLCGTSLCTSALAQTGTSFTYQARLTNNGLPVSSNIDIRFTMYSQGSGGSPLASTLITNLATIDGLFTTRVDFGVDPFTTNAEYWLSIEVRIPAGAGPYTLLGNRQRLTAAPFALATRGLSIASNGDTLLTSGAGGGTRIFGLPQGNNLSTNLLIQAGGTLESAGNAQNGGTLTLRAGNANLSAASDPPIGTSGGNDVVIQAGENTAQFAFFGRFSGNIRFIAGDSGLSTGNQPERMRILGDNGFVGIGTTTPASILDVRSASDPTITIGTPSGTEGALLLGNSAHGLRRNYRSTTNDVGLYTTSGALRFSTLGSAATQMTLSNAGNLGIGTLTPQTLLDVGGRVLINSSGNALLDGFIAPIRNASNTWAALHSGFSADGNAGYQISLVNTTQTALIGSFFSSYNTNQTTIQANIKNFVEPNPSDPSTDIYYASLEGPEAAMYTRGTGTLINGQAIISLPAHFSDLASSQGLTVQLTPQSADSLGLAVVAKGPTGFQVRELMRGTGTYQFDWEVKAIRKQYLNYEVVRSWNERRVVNPNLTQAQAWQIRKQHVAESNARANTLEAAAINAAQ